MMNRQEVKNLVGLATANFPNMQDKDMRPTATLWEKMLSDIPYNLAEKAIVKVLSTAKFFPTVAEIREAALEITSPNTLTAAEAWSEVTSAIRRYGSYREREALANVRPEVANMIKRFGWRELCTSEEVGVIRGQFIRAWDAAAKREKELAVLPSNLRDMIAGVTERKMIQ